MMKHNVQLVLVLVVLVLTACHPIVAATPTQAATPSPTNTATSTPTPHPTQTLTLTPTSTPQKYLEAYYRNIDLFTLPNPYLGKLMGPIIFDHGETSCQPLLKISVNGSPEYMSEVESCEWKTK